MTHSLCMRVADGKSKWWDYRRRAKRPLHRVCGCSNLIWWLALSFAVTSNNAAFYICQKRYRMSPSMCFALDGTIICLFAALLEGFVVQWLGSVHLDQLSKRRKQEIGFFILCLNENLHGTSATFLIICRWLKLLYWLLASKFLKKNLEVCLKRSQTAYKSIKVGSSTRTYFRLKLLIHNSVAISVVSFSLF